MKKSILILTLLILVLFSVSCTWASDANDTIVSNEDTGAIELSQSDEITLVDEIQEISKKNNTEMLSASNDEKVAVQNDLNVLDADTGTWSQLSAEIGSGGDKSLTYKHYTYGGGDTIVITTAGVIDGRGAIIDMAGSTIQAFKVSASGVTFKNLTIQNANCDNIGGTIYFSGSGTLENCNFINNTALYGGAIYVSTNDNCKVINCNFVDNAATQDCGAIRMYSGTVENCNFTNNKANRGGAVYFTGSGTVTDCNFTNNEALYGGAVYFDNAGTLTYCNFTNNSATNYGGAIYFSSSGTLENCNFINNTAVYGGAIDFEGEGTVKYCNFTNNKAISECGGAVFFDSKGNVTNCNFVDNKATGSKCYGGAICFYDAGNVENCNFTNNSASEGGAVYVNWVSSGHVSNCNFTNNAASLRGGAIVFDSAGEVTNCNFINNAVADSGGAVYFWNKGNVTNCNFTGNNATTGSAIYFEDGFNTKTVSDSDFLDNRADAESFKIVQNGDGVEIIFVGKNNIINAIYSKGDVSFNNVVYWGANGIANTDTSAPAISKNEAGQNITFGVVGNDFIILNTTKVTNENGMIVLGLIPGIYTITARHDADSYYTQAETTQTLEVEGIETSLELNLSGHTVIATITPDVGAANITFTAENESGVVKTVDAVLNEGAAEFDLTGLAGDYNVTATYKGNIGYYPSTNTIAVSDKVPMYVSDISIFYDEIANVVVGVPETINGQNIRISVNTTSKNGTVINGEAKAGFTDLSVGEYLIAAEYVGDGYHRANSTTAKLTVSKANSTLSVCGVTLDYGTSITITVETEGATGITAKIDGEDVLVEGYDIVIPVLSVGNHTLTVTTIPDENHCSVNKSAPVMVKVKQNTPISMDVSCVENNVTFTVGLDSDATGIVRFEVFGAEEYVVYADVVDGKVVMLDVLGVGDYEVVATYMGDNKFNSNITSESFTVKGHVKNDTPITADAKVNGNKVTITVNVDENATGFIGLNQSGSNIFVELVNGVAIFAPTLPVGSYNVNVIYSGDYNYNGNSTSVFFTIVEVDKENTTIALDVSTVDNNATYTVSLNPDATGIVRFEVSGAENYVVYADVIDGVAVLDDVLSVGDYEVIATYLGDDRFNTNTTSESFTVKGHVKKDTPISADVKVNGYRVTVTVNVDADATGFVNMKFADADFNVALTDGVGSLTINMPAGSYNLDATYLGDDNFNQNATKVSFTVEDPVKENTPISMDVSCDENDANFTVTLNPDATGIVRFELSGAEEYVVYADVINGEAMIQNILIVGDYNLIATYMGDSRFNSNITSASFTVSGHVKKDTPITADAKVNGNRVTITVNVDANATGFVGLKQSGSTIYVALEDGVATYVNTFAAGSYHIEVTYIGDDNFNENSTRVLFTVVEVAKKNTTISLDVSSVENNATYTVTLNPDATGIVRFEVSGAEEYVVYADVINGVAVMDDVLSVGDYEVVATYMGDNIFNTNATSESFTVKGHVKNDTPIGADVKVNGNRVTITVNVDADATGFVNMKFADGEFNVALSDGAGSLTINMPAGSYNMDLTYLGDDNFNQNATSVSFTVEDPVKENTPISMDVSCDENDANFTVSLNPDATGIVRFEVSGAEEYVVYADVINGEAMIQNILIVGDYNVIATYMGDSRFNSNITSASFTVSGHVKKDTPITADAKVNGNRVTVTVNVDADATGFVGLKQSGSTIYVELKDGVASYVNIVPAGSYNVEVTYIGDDNFNENSTRVLFTVVEVAKENTSISLDASSVYNNATFSVDVNENATGIVKFEISGDEEYTVYMDVIDGKSELEHFLKAGNYTITVTYMGDSRYNTNVTSQDFVINDSEKYDTNVSIVVPSDIKPGDSASVDVSIPGATGNVSVIVDGNEVIVPLDENGTASVVLENISSGGHSVVAIYLGDETHALAYAASSFDVPETPVIIPKTSEFSDITITDTQYLTAVLIDSDGNPIANATVTYAVNGIANTTVTAEDGQFTIKIENDALMAISYAGSEGVVGTNITLKLNSSAAPVVVKIATHFDVDNRAITINGYAVDTKAGEEGIYYATCLLDADGNPISNVYMEFAVNNKIYNRTTYENGSYKPYKLNMIRAGRYTMALNFAGDDNYTNAFACVCFDLDKKPITIKASAKSYKASTKTKKYTVSLKTIVGSSHDGKAHLRSGLKVTLKVNGKTYSGTTNSKGKVTFKITNLKKKAKYVAKISYAGDKTYKSASKSVKLTVK